VGGRVCVVGDDSSVHLLLDQVEDGREVGGAHAAGPVHALPFVEHVVGRAQHRHPVNNRSTAYAAALQEGDGEVVGGAQPLVGEETRDEGGLVLIEVVGGVEAALFEEDDVAASLGETSGEDGSAGAGADHADLGADGDVARNLVAAGDAARDAGGAGDRIGPRRCRIDSRR